MADGVRVPAPAAAPRRRQDQDVHARACARGHHRALAGSEHDDASASEALRQIIEAASVEDDRAFPLHQAPLRGVVERVGHVWLRHLGHWRRHVIDRLECEHLVVGRAGEVTARTGHQPHTSLCCPECAMATESTD